MTTTMAPPGLHKQAVPGGTAECRCCGEPASIVGQKPGEYAKRLLTVARCASCGFAFVMDYLENLSEVYNDDHYRGRGADPMVDYVGELEHPESIVRCHDWRGITRIVQTLRPRIDGLRWLDYGGGNGGLVRYVRDNSQADIIGFEEGWIADRSREAGIPIVGASRLPELRGTCDIVSAIEVIEHVVDPHAFFRTVRSLLKPGGLFFCTTGNAAPVRDLLNWSYVIPEIHVSFFEPRTLSRVLQQHGFRSENRGFLAGYDDVIRFKVLKNLGFRRVSLYERMIPWHFLARLVDRRFQVSALPIGVALQGV
jgi:SAM-dependent methyltransferase